MDKAQNLAPAEAAAEAVKAYLRMHRHKISDDPELLALLLPERFTGEPKLIDYQRFVIGRLTAEIASLRTQVESRHPNSDRASRTREGVKRLVLELTGANEFKDTIATARESKAVLGADFVAIGIECDAAFDPRELGMRLLPRGLVDRLIERDALGSLLIGDAYKIICPDAQALQSVAVFRMRFGEKAPPALYAIGSCDLGLFDDAGTIHEIAFFVRALEASIRKWLKPSPH
jgi:uncharacterized protein YigA (DUF484 family)